MKEIKINIDESCPNCQKALKYFEKLHEINEKAYSCYILPNAETLKKEKRDLGEQDRIKGVKLIPDYNCNGFLTHFHMEESK